MPKLSRSSVCAEAMPLVTRPAPPPAPRSALPAQLQPAQKHVRTSTVAKGYVAHKDSITGSCLLRVEPHDDSEFSSYDVPNETEVDVLATSGGYYLVKHKHMEGYMKSVHLRASQLS